MWLQQVQKELNGKAMGELEYRLDSLVNIDPIRAYLYDQNKETNEAKLPQTQYLTYLRVSSAKENALVLDALDGGSNGIFYEFQSDFDLSHLPALLKDVLSQMLYQVFDISQCIFTKEILELELEKLGIEKDRFAILNQNTIDISKGQVTFPIYDLLKQFLAKGELPNEPIILFPSQVFYTNIAAVRALRVLLMNLDENYVPKILVLKTARDENQDFNQNLIEFTTDTLSSNIGGADFVVLKPASNDLNQLSLLRNIPNLLQLESEMNTHYDGVAGARNLTFLVDKIAEEVWSKLKEE